MGARATTEKGQRGAPPRHIAPMLATSTSALPAGGEQWAFEFKWDGIRAIAHWDGDALRLETRNLNDVTVAYPELAPIGDQLGAQPAVLDGEIVALDEQGQPSFQRLQERMGVRDPHHAARRAEQVPVAYFVFDLLHLGERSTMPLPYRDRRHLLDDLDLQGPAWRTPAAVEGDGAATLAAATANGLEGVVAKRIDGTYQPGARSRSWRKLKLLEREDFVIGGWMPGERGRSGRLGALLLGRPNGSGDLQYVGSVGTGFREATLGHLEARLATRERATSPFVEGDVRRGARYVEPDLVAAVEFRERTAAGILRQPSFKGLRADIDPNTVTGTTNRIDLTDA